MWDISEINQKKRQVIKQIKTCKNKEEKDRLQITLASYISLLDNSGAIRYTKFYNLMDKITKGNFTLIKPSSKLIFKGESLVSKSNDYMDEDYLSFLLKLVESVYTTDRVISEDEEILYKKVDISNDELIKFSKLFYSSLGDSEIYEKAMKIINDPTALNFSKSFSSSYNEAGGITYWDYVFDKAYCTTKRSDNSFDVQAFNHEVMHGIDFYFQQKIPTEIYYGFHETPTYAIDYLFIDYLETIGFDKEEIQKLKVTKDAYLQLLAARIKVQINNQLIRQKGFGYLKKHTTKDVFDILTPNIIKNLLELESGIISFGLYKQFNENFEIGIDNLKQFMKTKIPKNMRPNFSNIGLSDEKLMELSYEIGMYSRKNEETAKVK